MPLKRKTRNLPNMNDKEKMNQMSFFDPVYQNDSNQISDVESDSGSSVNNRSRQNFRDKNNDESNETLDADPIGKNETFDQDPSTEISTAKIIVRIKQIQNSIQQAQTMLESMEKFKNLVPGSHEQCEKLHVIITNLEEQQAGYVNLLNLITLTNEERSELLNRISTTDRQISTNPDDQSNDDDEEDDEDEDDDQSPRRHVQSPVRPRIESKIGFTPQPIISTTPTVPATINSSDNEQNNRNDNSNYDSLVGSLKSDTINWKDQESTSGDEASDVESEKEIERNLMLQKEQLRALQGQKRALLALKKRSEKRLIEQQQLHKKQNDDQKEDLPENDLLGDINTLRDRLKLLRNLYEQKHEVEVQQIKNSSKKQPVPTENRIQNLQYVREQLDELENIVTYYQLDVMNQQEEETTVYEETPIQPDDVQRLKTLIMQQKQQTPPPPPTTATISTNDNAPKHLDKLSNELAAKRLELEQAKAALSRLQQMVKKIEPDECSSSVRSTPIQSSSKKATTNNDYNQFQYTPTSSQQTQKSVSNTKTSLLSSILSPKPTEQQKPMPTTNTYADAKMAAQHREIERLVESRQRLHTIKDEIASLHQSIATTPVPSKKASANETKTDKRLTESKKQTNIYEDKSRISANRQADEEEDDDDDSELYRFECESGDGEEIDDDSDQEIQPRIKQGNFHAPEDIVAEHEQRLLNTNTNDDLSTQVREICRCLSTFIQEQKSFNRHIEQHLTAVTNTPPPPSVSVPTTFDPVFNQLQQQVLTQGLIVNLNTAYREIAVLQSEMNALQSENNRLTSSFDRLHLYSRDNSKESLYSLDPMKTIRPQPRSRFDEHNHLLTTTNKFENSSKTSFSSQSTGKQTAIRVNKNNMETTPTKYERNATFTAECLSSPKPIHLRTNQITDEYEISSNHHRKSSKENLSKSFIIRRRPISNNNENTLIKSQLFNYDQPSSIEQYQQNTFDDDDDDDDSDSEDEQQINDLSATIFNIQPSAYYTSTTNDLDNIDVQTIDLQVKSIMVQLIPFMRLNKNEIFNQSILHHIRERLLFLFKQQPDSAQLIRHFQNQLSESLGKTLEKYYGTTIRDCAVDLIRDISDVAFDELVRYQIYENTNNVQTTNNDEQIIQPLSKQQDEYIYDSSVRHYAHQASSIDDGENDNKYQIELAESESRPLNLIGSDEEDNDSDQEENKDSELETAVSRQESNLNQNENTSSSELHSNGHEYVLVNRSTSNDIVNDVVPESEEKKNEDDAENEGSSV